MGTLADKAAKALAYGGLGNFLLYGLVSASLGGTALPGKIAGARYFLRFRASYQEVSQATFHYSRIHGLITLTGFVIALLSVAFLMWRHPEG